MLTYHSFDATNDFKASSSIPSSMTKGLLTQRDRSFGSASSDLYRFSRMSSNLTSVFNLGTPFDMGVVDVNNDNIFDVFTSNHDSLQSLLLGSTSGEFTDVLSRWGLSQDANFPGFEEYRFKPPAAAQGFYIYRRSAGELRLELLKSQTTGPVRGSIVIPSNHLGRSLIKVIAKHHSTIAIHETAWQQGRKITLDFTIRPKGRLILNTQLPEVPYFFQLDKSFPLQRVYVGAEQVNPQFHQFTTELQDRHGIAWADYQGDGWMDVFMSRGGIKGKMLEFPQAAHIQDQLFVNQGNNVFKDQASDLGILKQGCRSRKVAWVDFNQDNRLDLYISGLNSPNLLFQQMPSGKFKDVAPQLRLNLKDSVQFEWLDVDQDADPDLLIARSGKIDLFINQNHRFKRHQSISFAGGTPDKLAIADYDQDNDLDVYVTSAQSSRLLTNTGGRFTAHNPKVVGLPTKVLAANWVDVDNDGLLDFHVIPGGLYRQLPNHTFEYVRSLSKVYPDSVAFSNAFPIVKAHCTWFDADNNGTRDLLYAYHQKVPWEAELYNNQNSQNHWLQLQLVGPKHNRQAIGASVTLITSDGQQLQQVGNAEGSHYSQGHYRLYFGLGQNPVVNSIQITWADGTKQAIATPTSNQLLTVKYEK